MKYIEPSASIIEKDDFFKMVAMIAHNCYQAQTGKDDEGFIKRLIESKHYAMIEHYRFAYEIDANLYSDLIQLNNRFIELVKTGDSYFASTSLRVFLEMKDSGFVSAPVMKLISCLDKKLQALLNLDLIESNEAKILSEEEIDKLDIKAYEVLKYVTVRMVTDRGVTHEIVRHRLCSFAQESTRYCNYSKNKFGNELIFIKPLDYEANGDIYDKVFSDIEAEYMVLTKQRNVVPEFARSILPNKIKATIVVTASIQEWNNIFALRLNERAHPDMRQVMQLVLDGFNQKGLLR